MTGGRRGCEIDARPLEAHCSVMEIHLPDFKLCSLMYRLFGPDHLWLVRQRHNLSPFTCFFILCRPTGVTYCLACSVDTNLMLLWWLGFGYGN